MQIPQDMLIDLALNVVGYVAAGALSLVVFSMFRRTPRRVEVSDVAAAEPGPVRERSRAEAPVTGGRKPMQYVGFGGGSADEEGGGQRLTLRRNRTEVLRLARGMVRSGASDAEIKAALPVSDAELAVLTYERK